MALPVRRDGGEVGAARLADEADLHRLVEAEVLSPDEDDAARVDLGRFEDQSRAAFVRRGRAAAASNRTAAASAAAVGVRLEMPSGRGVAPPARRVDMDPITATRSGRPGRRSGRCRCSGSDAG